MNKADRDILAYGFERRQAKRKAAMIEDQDRLLEIAALKMTVEESSELIAELKMAIAGFVGEKLVPCDPIVCPGHFGPAAQELFKLGLESYGEKEEA